jgi:hypothetical protein
MSGKVYPIGYSAPGASMSLETLMQDEQTILVDIRFSVKSMRKPAWSGSALRERYGNRYLWIQELGNVNYYSGGDIKLHRPEKGIERLMMGLQKGYNLILLCTCNEYETCHRKKVVELLQQAEPEVEVVQLDTAAVSDGSIMCLSVRQPYASWLVHPKEFLAAGVHPKTIENRDWTTRHRGKLLIHASKTFEQDEFEYWTEQSERLSDIASREEMEYPSGAIVGIADLVDVVEKSDDPWFMGRYGWQLKDAHAFDEPIPYRGALKLFPVPKSVVQLQTSSV